MRSSSPLPTISSNISSISSSPLSSAPLSLKTLPKGKPFINIDEQFIENINIEIEKQKQNNNVDPTINLYINNNIHSK